MSDVLHPRWLSNAIILLLLVTVFSFLSPFIVPFVWGFWLAILTWPLFLALEQRISRPWLSATLMLLIMLLLIGLPIGLLLHISASELHRLVRFVLTANSEGLPVPDWLAGLPIIGKEAVDWWQTSWRSLKAWRLCLVVNGTAWPVRRAKSLVFWPVGSWPICF